MNITKYLAVLAAAIIFISACNQAPTTPNPTTPNTAVSNKPAAQVDTPNKTAEVTPAPQSALVTELATGKELYATNCMICHKDTGKGGKVTIDGKSINPDDLTSEKMKKKANDKLIRAISEGSPDDGMPAFESKLTEEEITTIIKHIRTL